MPDLILDDFEFGNAPFCEHCMDLEPFSAAYDDDGVSWCLVCIQNIDDFETGEMFSISKDELKKIEAFEKSAKKQYFERRIKDLEG